MEKEELDLIIMELEDKLGKTLSVLKEEYSGIRAGRANPHVLDKVTVSYYGEETPINQTCNISVQEGRCLVLTPWDTSLLKNLERAVLASGVGITPTNDGKVIRLVFPELTEERRIELTRKTKKMGEDAKVASRNVRREILEQFKKLKTDKEISEDEYSSYEKEVEKIVTEAIAKIDEEVALKEKDLMTV
ncbi:MAG: ribosome recycling factor [Clostridia bacterium]|nr:ribosome recycling factor [Clostridia bacterium]